MMLLVPFVITYLKLVLPYGWTTMHQNKLNKSMFDSVIATAYNLFLYFN